MDEMILLGAGASVDAGVPGAYDMTKAIMGRFRSNPLLSKHAHVISFVTGGLLFQAGMDNADPLTVGVNVEELFNAVQLLAERGTLEVAPFVGSWHAMVEEFDKAYPSHSNSRSLSTAIYRIVSEEIRRAFSDAPPAFEADKIDTALASTIHKSIEAVVKSRSLWLGAGDKVGRAVEHYVKELTKQWSNRLRSRSPSGSTDFDRELSRIVDERRPQPGEGRIFHETNDRMIAALKDLVWIETGASVEYLGPILNLLSRQNRLVVATLNYDNSIELLANSQGVPLTTGIEHWSTTGTFAPLGQALFLLKLHGSIDWTWERNARSHDRPMPHSIIRQVNRDQMRDPLLQPAVIFGQHNKLTAEGPFLDLLRAFREELSRASKLTVVGYSFRDPHINVFISQWLNASWDHTVRIVAGPDAERESVEYTQHLLELRARSPQQVEFIPQYAVDGLRTLYGVYGGSLEEAEAVHGDARADGMTRSAASTGPPAPGTVQVPRT